MEIYDSLYREFGPQGWWPASTPFEVMVGAILTQNTAWGNVERAIRNLKEAGALTPEGVLGTDPRRLEALIKPAGYYRVKAERLRSLCRFLMEEFGGRVQEMASRPLEELRQRLLQLKGVGPETADSILLYALDKPIFVVDAYTRRVLGRHGLVGDSAPYEEVQRLFMGELPKDVGIYKEYHALLVKLGKTHCRPKPRCGGCPLEGL